MSSQKAVQLERPLHPSALLSTGGSHPPEPAASTNSVRVFHSTVT